MSSSSEQRNSIRKMPDKRKRASNFCSTPVVGNARRLSSISISAVDTNSSSSTKQRTVEVDPERKRIKKKRLQKNSLEQRESKQIGKASKKMGKGRRKKKKLIEQKKSDDEWETYNESLRQPTVFENNVLFKDIPSPEHIREAPHFVHDWLDSPILKLRGWEVDSPEEIIFKENDTKLIVKDLPSSHVRFDDNDNEEERANTVKSYPGLKNKKLQGNNASIERDKAWLVNVSVPTTSSDLLWENFIRNNCNKVEKYLAPPANNRQRYQHDSDESCEEKDNYGQLPKWNDQISLELADNMKVAHGYWDKSLRKWVRVHDVYSFRENKDAEFKKNGGNTTHITLNQFLQRKKSLKKNMAELGSSYSSAIYSPNVRENIVEKKKRKKKRFPKNVKSEFQKLDAFEMQSISKVRNFASQINATKKTMCPNEISSVSTLKNTRPNCVLKRSSRDEAHKKENDTKRISLTEMKNKPKVKSVNLLTSARFKKDKQNWRIVKNLV